jgi:hypothetical protein
MAMLLYNLSGGVCPSFLVTIGPVSVFRVESIHPGESTDRVERLTRQIEVLVPSWRMAPVIHAYQALRLL